ncbi:esterase/lipase family protein [Pseudomonas panipatensis]|uniref:DUF7379 domain-containing protein n=1 Tax=Pseudomonas panipatensis TaxID=428992 RepID=A0A1G8FET2_9PSED|nr:hypothetical protein [Pseudomonas panipatensis]SDH80674.1 hypothetical protein SAMN05216272_103204 [Pseudomonas panipatensis]SMP54116.1 hypothetical protein SAMN06295951_103255 [Pseudomonas panipatensis]
MSPAFKSPLDLAHELQKALFRASTDGELLGSGIALQAAIHPLTRELGFSMPGAAPALAQANLTILQNLDSKVVQFVFPVQGALPLPAGALAGPAGNFDFIRQRQFGNLLGELGNWIVSAALNIPQRLEGDTLAAAAHSIEAASKNEGFIDLAQGYTAPASPSRLAGASGKRVLLFVHGIFSSIQGAFQALGPADQPSVLQTLLQRYQGNVFGYDHWTISKTPLENALDLLDAIPAGANWTIDLVCHSRGGLVCRSLLADPSAAASLANPDLLALPGKRQGKIAGLNRALFVAAANQGSPLANPDDIRNFLNVAALLASTSGCFALDSVIGLARLAVSSAFDLPSIQQLATTSSLVRDLNASPSLLSVANAYAARADFDHAQSPLLEAGVLIDKLLMPVDNDLVVPYLGAAQPDPLIASDKLLNFGTPTAKQGSVWHTEFFSQAAVHDQLLAIFPPLP